MVAEVLKLELYLAKREKGTFFQRLISPKLLKVLSLSISIYFQMFL
jgi:hypothetical protein